MSGLAEAIPDQQQRINHILKNQVFGIAITQLTAMLSRRSIYCSKTANGKYSVCNEFSNIDGNMKFKLVKHRWTMNQCYFCGASQNVYDRGEDLETHAYLFTHTEDPKEIFNMKFDVIVGNPPYQLSDGGAQASAIPLYHRFIQQAIKLNPRFLSMIIPARWFAGGRNLDSFRDSMLSDPHIRKLYDYPISSDIFPGVEIKGGVCYFLWERDNPGLCEVNTIRGQNVSKMSRPLMEEGNDTFIRFNESISIYRKVKAFKEQSFCDIVSSQKPFGFRTYFRGRSESFMGSVTLFANNAIDHVSRESILQNIKWIDKPKIFISAAYGAGEDYPHQILNKPIYGPPNSCCTETYVVIGPFNSKR